MKKYYGLDLSIFYEYLQKDTAFLVFDRWTLKGQCSCFMIEEEKYIWLRTTEKTKVFILYKDPDTEKYNLGTLFSLEDGTFDVGLSLSSFLQESFLEIYCIVDDWNKIAKEIYENEHGCLTIFYSPDSLVIEEKDSLHIVNASDRNIEGTNLSLISASYKGLMNTERTPIFYKSLNGGKITIGDCIDNVDSVIENDGMVELDFDDLIILISGTNIGIKKLYCDGNTLNQMFFCSFPLHKIGIASLFLAKVINVEQKNELFKFLSDMNIFD